MWVFSPLYWLYFKISFCIKGSFILLITWHFIIIYQQNWHWGTWPKHGFKWMSSTLLSTVKKKPHPSCLPKGNSYFRLGYSSNCGHNTNGEKRLTVPDGVSLQVSLEFKRFWIFIKVWAQYQWRGAAHHFRWFIHASKSRIQKILDIHQTVGTIPMERSGSPFQMVYPCK